MEGVFVDGDDDDRRRWGPLTAQLEEAVERAQLDRIEWPEQRQGDHGKGGSPAGDEGARARQLSERHPADYTAKQGDEGGWLGASGLSARHPEDKFFPGRAHHIGKRGLFQAKPEHAPRPTVRPVVDGNEDRTRMRRVVDRTRHSPGMRHPQDLDGDQWRLVGVIEIAQAEDATLAAIEHDLEHLKAALEHLM